MYNNKIDDIEICQEAWQNCLDRQDGDPKNDYLYVKLIYKLKET